jgi:hypothetical protein
MIRIVLRTLRDTGELDGADALGMPHDPDI